VITDSGRNSGSLASPLNGRYPIGESYDALPEGAMRRASNLSSDLKFYNCSNQVETVMHILRDCPVARHVWRRSCLGLNMAANMIVPLQSWIIDWSRNFLSLKNAAKERVIELPL